MSTHAAVRLTSSPNWASPPAADSRGETAFSAKEIGCIENAAKKVRFSFPIDDGRTVTGIYVMY